MQFPAYWWLLALLICLQGAFFVRITIVRLQRKEVQPLSPSAAVVLYLSAILGLVYAVVQRDPVFFLGQGCLLGVYYRTQRLEQDNE